jgi:hypothetical protein
MRDTREIDVEARPAIAVSYQIRRADRWRRSPGFDAGAHLDQPPDQRAALLNIQTGNRPKS